MVNPQESTPLLESFHWNWEMLCWGSQRQRKPDILVVQPKKINSEGHSCGLPVHVRTDGRRILRYARFLLPMQRNVFGVCILKSKASWHAGWSLSNRYLRNPLSSSQSLRLESSSLTDSSRRSVQMTRQTAASGCELENEGLA